MKDDIAVDLRATDIADGHVTHTALVAVADHARGRWLDRTFGVPPSSPWPYVIVRLELDFRALSVLADRALRCRFQAMQIGGSSVRVQERVSAPDGRVIVESRSTVVAWDPDRNRPRALTHDERDRLGAAPAD